MDELRSTIQEFTDEELLRAYFEKKDEYTPEAREAMRVEVEKRGLSEASLGTAAAPKSVADPAASLSLMSGDFIAFEHSFSPTDWLLASAILRDNDIPCFADNPTSTPTFPIEGEGEKWVTIRIHKDFVEKARELLDEHFIIEEKKYLLRYSSVRDRLKAFNFHDIPPSDGAPTDTIEVSLTADEKVIVVGLARRLVKEAETIEKEQDRILFFFDSIEPLIERLEIPNHPALTRADLLTLIEILQVYVNDPALPASMDEAISQLLSFFLER